MSSDGRRCTETALLSATFAGQAVRVRLTVGASVLGVR